MQALQPLPALLPAGAKTEPHALDVNNVALSYDDDDVKSAMQEALGLVPFSPPITRENNVMVFEAQPADAVFSHLTVPIKAGLQGTQGNEYTLRKGLNIEGFSINTLGELWEVLLPPEDTITGALLQGFMPPKKGTEFPIQAPNRNSMNDHNRFPPETETFIDALYTAWMTKYYNSEKTVVEKFKEHVSKLVWDPEQGGNKESDLFSPY